MTTTVVHSIGTSGRDYSTIAAWVAALPSNLVTADQLWQGELYNDSEFTQSGSSTLCSISVSIVTDATRYIILKAAAGQGYRDNAGPTGPLKYDQTKGVGLRLTSGYGSIIAGSGGSVDLVVDGLQISYDSTSSSNYSPPVEGLKAIHNCLFETRQTANNVIDKIKELVNNVVVMRGTSFSGTALRPTADNPGVDHFINNTVVRPSDLTAGGTGISGGGDGYPVVSNNVVMGFTTPFGGTIASYGSGSGNNASDVASGNIPGTSNQASLTQSAQFTSSADATRDWRPNSGGALVNNGSRQNTYTADLDIMNGARSVTTPTIGAREYIAAAGGSQFAFRKAASGGLTSLSGGLRS